MTEAPRPVLKPIEVQKLAMETAAKGAEKAASSSALTNPEKAVAEVAAKNLAANKARDAALTVTTGLTHTADAEQIESRLFHSKVGPDGKRTADSAAETGRLNQVKALRETYTRLILDPTSLSAADITLLNPQIVSMINNNAAAFPGLKEAFTSGAGFDAALVKGLMRNPQVVNKLASEMNRVYDLGAKNLPDITQLEENMMQAEQDIAAATKEKTNIANKKSKIMAGPADEIAFNSTATYTYTKADGTASAAQTKAGAMAEINTALATGGGDIAKYTADIAEIRAYEQMMQVPGISAQEKATYSKDIQDRRGRTIKAEADPQYGNLCKTYKALETERLDIDSRVKASKDVDVINKLDADIQKQENEIASKTKRVENLKLEKNTKVGEIESAMKKALENATAAHITEEKIAFFENYPQFEQEARTVIEEKARHAMHEVIKNRYFTMEAVPANIWEAAKKIVGANFKDTFRPVFNHSQASADLKAMTKYGFDEKDMIIRFAGAAKPPMDAEAMKVLVRDPQFVKEQMSVITQRALRAYEWKNGLGEEMISGLVATEWGAAALDYTIKQNESARDLTRDYEAGGGSISRSLIKDVGPGFLFKLLMFLGALGVSPFFSLKKQTI